MKKIIENKTIELINKITTIGIINEYYIELKKKLLTNLKKENCVVDKTENSSDDSKKQIITLFKYQKYYILFNEYDQNSNIILIIDNEDIAIRKYKKVINESIEK